MRRRIGKGRHTLNRLRVTFWTRLKQAALTVYGLSIRVKVVSRVGLPLCRGFIVTANHLNGADSVVLQIALRTRLFFAASARWFRTGLSRFVMWHICDAVPVQNDDPLSSTPGLRHCLTVLRSGASIGIYPEGAYNRGGPLECIRDGAAYLAVRTGTPILPVYIRNLRYERRVDDSTQPRECWTGFLSVADNLFNTRIELLVGEPVEPERVLPGTAAEFRTEVERVNDRLLAEYRRIVFGNRPA